MSPILIPSNTLRDAKRLFGRLKHLRCKLPVLQHLMLTAGQNGIQLAATDLDHWLETQVSDPPAEYACFLIPPSAMDAACRADKGTDVTFAVRSGKRSPELRLTIRCGGITATSDHPTLDPSEIPSRPTMIGTVTELPPTTLEGLSIVAGCASSDTTRQILNGVYFTPEDGGRLIASDGKRLACCPAVVPQQDFCLALAACHILGHPNFTAGMATVTWIDHKDPEKRHVAIGADGTFWCQSRLSATTRTTSRSSRPMPATWPSSPTTENRASSPGCARWAKAKPPCDSTGTSAVSSH